MVNQNEHTWAVSMKYCPELDVDERDPFRYRRGSRLLKNPGRSLASPSLTFKLNVAEETVGFSINTGGEEKFVGCARGIAITELQGPQAIDLYWDAHAILK